MSTKVGMRSSSRVDGAGAPGVLVRALSESGAQEPKPGVEAGRPSPGRFGRDHTLEAGGRIDGATTLRDGDVVALGPVSIVIERMPSGGSTATHPQS
jgi:hypothetical protein